jgi:hypothetical protein
MNHSSEASQAPIVPSGTVAKLPWLRVALLAFGLLAASIAGLEGYWRVKGYRPNVTDSKDLWCFWRRRVYRDDGKIIVFLGTSRILADISLETMQDCLPEYRTIQLGINGAKSCVGLLKGFADDPAFRGIVVCELDTPLLERSLWLDHEEYQRYQPLRSAEYTSAATKAFLADYCVVLRPAFSIRESLRRYLLPGTWPPADAICGTFRRETQWRFRELPDVERLRLSTTAQYEEQYAQHRFPSFRSLAAEIHDINGMVRTLRARGGNVVLLRAPSSGHRWQLEERQHPKVSNWDNLAAATDACCIHFSDHAQMCSLRCPDESHLDVSDAQQFTRLVAHELVLCGVASGETR